MRDYEDYDNNFDIDFNFGRVRSFPKLVNPNKAAGLDEINGKMLKNCAVSLDYPLGIIFQTSYNSGMIHGNLPMFYLFTRREVKCLLKTIGLFHSQVL